jgi:Cytochrome c oxidase subunit IV
MKVEAYLFGFIAVFLAPVAVVYWLWSGDPTGTTALTLAVLLGSLVSSYLFITARRIDDRPEDDLEGEIADGAGEMGFFSPYSWAPLWCAGSAALIFAGIVFGWWMTFIGAALAVPAVGSMIFEYAGEDAPV